MNDAARRIKYLLGEIKQEAMGLSAVFWSPNQVYAVRNAMDTLQATVEKNISDTIKNLNWYQTYGWKKFAVQRNLPTEQEAQADIQNEKERIEGWSKQFYKISMYGKEKREGRQVNFLTLLKDQVLEFKLVQKLIQHGYSQLNQAHVLDIGCGDGRWLRKFIDWGASPNRLVGVDVNKPILKLAEQLTASELQFIQAHADELPFSDQQFEIVLMMGVLQSVLDAELRKKIAQEIRRVLANDGILITYNMKNRKEAELTPFLAATNKGLAKEELEQLFPDCLVEFESILNDIEIYQYIDHQWGALYDRAIDTELPDQQFGFAVIRKKASERND